MANYKLQAGPDGTVWVSVQPLMRDIQETLETLMETDIEFLTQEQQTHLGMKMVGLNAIQEFMQALLTEHEMNKVINEKTI